MAPKLPVGVRFEDDALVLEQYPFPRGDRPARIPVSELTQVCCGWFPPAVETKEGEFLFVFATQAQALHDFAVRHAIPFVWRIDIWGLLLEPFLDTDPGPPSVERDLATLERHGVSRSETAQIREALKYRMMMLTALTWEWVHYGMYDALQQMNGFPFMSGWSFERFYEYAMGLAGKGSVKPATPDAFIQVFRPKPKSP